MSYELHVTLGAVGAFLPVMPAPAVPVAEQREAAVRLEAAGYPAAWSNEVIGKDVFTQLGVLLAATEAMTFGTCIANMWARPAQTAAGAAATLAEAYPGRFVLGLGVGYAEQAASVGSEFGKPLATSRAYLGAFADAHHPVLLGAMGPKMLALAAEAADGALPAGVGAAATAEARQVLSEDKLLVVYVDAGGDGAVDTIGAHLEAGADHVIAGSTIGADFAAHVAQLERLAPQLF